MMHETSVMRERQCSGCGQSWNVNYLMLCQYCFTRNTAVCEKEFCPYCRANGKGVNKCNSDPPQPFPKPSISEAICNGCDQYLNTAYLIPCLECGKQTCGRCLVLDDCPHCRQDTETLVGIDLSKDRDYFAIVLVKNGKVERIINARNVDFDKALENAGIVE